jgi:1-acyl-sn-glycerol-3-phosphate acyltransferase
MTALINSMNSEVTKVHGVTPSIVCLLPPRSIQKTTSGKIARQWVRRAYLEGKLNELHQWNAMNDALNDDDYFVEDAVPVKMSLMDASDSAADLNPDAIDPTGLPLEQILVDVQKAVSMLVNKPYQSLASDVPLVHLGMDSMRGIELQSLLEKRFTVQLPEALMFEPDATLFTLAYAFHTGGKVKQRPFIVNGWEIVQAARAQITGKNAGKSPPPGALPAQFFKEHARRANVDTLKFPDRCATALAPLTKLEEFVYICVSLWLFGMFLIMPIAFILALIWFPVKYVVSTLVVWLIGIYTFPAERWPPAFRRDHLFEIAVRYFSYRIIIEQQNIPTEIPAVYAMGPHGVFCIGHSIQTLVNEFIFGTSFHHLAASATFWVPMYNITLKMMGYKSVDRSTFKGLIEKGRSVGVVPGGIAEMFAAGKEGDEKMVVLQRKGFVRIALETGSQIIPCYCFGNTQTFIEATGGRLEGLSRALRMSLLLFWGRFYLPVPFRTPLLTVVGRLVSKLAL